MNSIVAKIKPWLNQLDFIFFALSILTLTLSIKLSSKFLFIALVLGLLKSITNKDFRWYKINKPITYVYSIFLTYIVLQGLFVDGPDLFFRTFEKDYAPYLVLILISIFFQDFEKVKYIPVLIITGVLFTIIIITTRSLLELQLFDRARVLKLLDLHHLYASFYILFSINHLLFSRNKIKIFSKGILTPILLLLLFSSLIFFKSKSAIAIGVLLFLFYTIKKYNFNRRLVIIFGVSALLIIFLFKTHLYTAYINALDFRLRIWEASIELIVQNPIFGFGNAQEIKMLNKRHFINGDYYFLDSNLNAHNQSLTFLLKFGLTGLLLMLSSWLYPILRTDSNTKKEIYGFLFLMFSMMFIESMYNRHHGIVFITIVLYYYSYFASNSKHKSEL